MRMLFPVLVVQFYFCMYSQLREHSYLGSGCMKVVGVGAYLKEIAGLHAQHILQLRPTPY
jgi:hypothetical protein